MMVKMVIGHLGHFIHLNTEKFSLSFIPQSNESNQTFLYTLAQ